MQIISIYNHKGGVTKTETTKQMADMLLLGGKNVLVIDLDPQANLATDRYGLNFNSPGVDQILKGNNRYHELFFLMDTYDEYFSTMEKKPTLAVLPPGPSINLNYQGLDREALKKIAKDLVHEIRNSHEFKNFDYCLIDNPPSNRDLTRELLPLVDKIITPYKPDKGSANSAIRTHQILKVMDEKIDNNMIVLVPSLVRVIRWLPSNDPNRPKKKTPLPSKMQIKWINFVKEYVAKAADDSLIHTEHYSLQDEGVQQAYDDNKLVYLSKAGTRYAGQFTWLIAEMLPEIYNKEFFNNIIAAKQKHNDKYTFQKKDKVA